MPPWAAIEWARRGESWKQKLFTLKPLAAMDTCVSMGSSIGNAVGMSLSRAERKPIVATIGDSTFLHSGIPPLVDAVYNKANITVVMPVGSPLVKATACRSFGAEVVLFGTNYDEACGEARRLATERGLTWVHAFDDPVVIAGQGTVGLEILEQLPETEAIVVPVGGGGLIGGIALAVKSLNPKVRVYGVETERVASMEAALAAGKIVDVPGGRTLADGIAVRRAGEHTFPLVRDWVDGIATVDEEEIASAILTLMEREKTVAEGAGATPLAALANRKLALSGRRVVLVVSGGNIDVNILSRIIERGLVKDGRLMRMMVRIPDVPGALAKLTTQVAETRANIVEIHHQRAFSTAELGETDVELTLETRGPDHIEELRALLTGAGYRVVPRA